MICDWYQHNRLIPLLKMNACVGNLCLLLESFYSFFSNAYCDFYRIFKFMDYFFSSYVCVYMCCAVRIINVVIILILFSISFWHLIVILFCVRFKMIKPLVKYKKGREEKKENDCQRISVIFLWMVVNRSADIEFVVEIKKKESVNSKHLFYGNVYLTSFNRKFKFTFRFGRLLDKVKWLFNPDLWYGIND